MGPAAIRTSRSRALWLGGVVAAAAALVVFWPYVANSVGRLVELETRQLDTPDGSILVSSYGAPRLALADAGVDLTNPIDQPAGLKLRIAPGSFNADRMLVTFDMQSTAPAVLKRGLGDGASKGMAAASNTILFTSPEESLRVALRKGTLSIRNVHLIPCRQPWPAECRTDAELIAELQATSGFPRATTDLELARYLLDWGANAADFDGGGTLRRMEGLFSALSAAEIYYQYYSSNRLAGYCASIATFQDKLFRAFGLDSFTFTFGSQEEGQDITHTSVVVRDRDSKRFFIFDPTFNLYFIDGESNEPLDVEQMLTLPVERIRYVPRSLARRDFIQTKEESVPSTAQDCREGYPGPGVATVACRRPDYGIHTYLKDSSKGLKVIGLRADISAYPELIKRGVFAIGEGSDSPADEDFAALLRRLGVTYPAKKTQR